MFQWRFADPDQTDLALHVIELSNHHLVDKVLDVARDELVHLRDEPVFDGYEADTLDNVHAQVAAVYRACLKQLDIAWALEPQDRFAVSLTQVVRSITEIERSKVANCIEICTLFAAALLKVGLNPLIVVAGPPASSNPTHAFIGYWVDKRHADGVYLAGPDLRRHLPQITFVETVRLLRPQKNQSRFEASVAEAARYFEPADHAAIARPRTVSPDASGGANRLAVFYAVNLRAQLLALEHALPAIAIIGTKGGVGKTSIAARIAELIAESNHNVVLVDLDIHNEGSTIFHQARVFGPQPRLKTVYEYVARYTRHAARAADWGESEGLWDVTPPFLDRADCGRVFLIAAHPPGALDFPDVMHSVSEDTPKRNAKLKQVIADIRRAVAGSEERIDCLVIDCGAGLEPVYASALRTAKYPFAVANPEGVSLRNFTKLRSQLADADSGDIVDLALIINRARAGFEANSAANAWSGFSPVAVIPEDPRFQEDYYASKVYFDLGYDVMSTELVKALESRLKGLDARLIPSEADLWLRPWLDRLRTLEGKEALRRDGFWRGYAAAVALVIGAVVLMIAASIYAPSYSGTTLQTKERVFLLRDLLGEKEDRQGRVTVADIVQEFDKRQWAPVPARASLEALLSVESASSAQNRQFLNGLALLFSVAGLLVAIPRLGYLEVRRRLIREILRRTDPEYAAELLKEFASAEAPGWFQAAFGKDTSLEWPRRSAVKWLRSLIDRERGEESRRRRGSTGVGSLRRFFDGRLDRP